MSSPRRCRSTADPVSGWPIGWRPCWWTPRSCCCSTTASTSSTRSPNLVEVLLARCPNVTVVATIQRAPAGARRAVVHGAAAGVVHAGGSCGAVVRRAGSRRGSRLRSGSGASSRSWPRSCGGWTGFRWPSSWRRPGCTRSTWPRWRPGSTAGSSCSRPATARRPATVRCTRRCRGRSACSIRRCNETFADLSVFAGPFTVADAAAICDADADTVGVALNQLVERSLVTRALPTADTCCSRRSERSARSSSPPVGEPSSRASAMLATRSLGSRPPIGGWWSRRLRRPSRRSMPRCRSCARRSVGCSTTSSSSSPAGWSPPSSTTGSCDCVPTSWPGPSG